MNWKPKSLILMLALGSIAESAVELDLDTDLPENPNAIDHCLAKVRVDAARLRESPSLTSQITGVRGKEEPVYVQRVMGKWAQVVLEDGDTAYIANYLLAFSWHEMLDQWKKSAAPPTVGKKARVKWANVDLRPYPSTRGGRLGQLRRHDWVGVLTEDKQGWSLVQVTGAIGFVRTRALRGWQFQEMPSNLKSTVKSHVNIPAILAYQMAPLAKVRHTVNDRIETPVESPQEYLAHSAWSPELFQITWQEHKAKALEQARIAWEKADDFRFLCLKAPRVAAIDHGS
jgi:hypothetical protein